MSLKTLREVFEKTLNELYMLFSAIAISLLIDAFYDGFLEDTVEANLETSIQIMMWSAPFIILFFVSFEIFLISKLRKINRKRFE